MTSHTARHSAQRRFFVLNMPLVLEFWQRERRRFFGMMALTVVSVAITIAFPRVMGMIVDGIQQGLSAPEQFSLNSLVLNTLILLGLGVTRSISSNIWFYSMFRSTGIFGWQTRTRVFAQLLNKGLSFTNQYPTGDVLVRMDDDMDMLAWFSALTLMWAIQSALTLVFTLAVLISMSWTLTVITVLPVSLTVLVWLRMGPGLFKRYKDWREKISATSSALEASYSGIRLVKAYTMEERSRRNFRRVLNERVAAALKATRSDALVDALFGGISEIGVLLVLTAGGVAVIGARISLGSFVAFNAYVLSLIMPLFFIGNLFVRGKLAQAAEERIRSLRDFPPDIETTSGTRPAPPQAELCLRHVGFRYPAARTEETSAPNTQTRAHYALSNINLTIEPGTRVGIAGTVGSGKTTLMRLLLRIAEPTEGEITLGGVPIKDFEIKSLRAMFGYAPQEASLISDSIESNVTLGRTAEDTEAQVREVTGIAQLETELANMPRGLKEMIGERGVKLSGGQQGQVSIARALFGKPRILLLDDVTASLDAETEQQFIRDVTEYMKGASLVIVSHRLAILAACDKIYVLDKGEIVESGTHRELLEKKGIYWQLYERQLMKEALERE